MVAVAAVVVVAVMAAGTGMLAAPASGAASSSAAHPPLVRHQVVFSFTDRDITESSGLVDAGRLMYTMNDSGHGPVLYAVDKRTGDTVATTTYTTDKVSDVEALAPGSRGTIWAGDIGDNNADRDSVSVYRVAPAAPTVTAPRFGLVYPGGPRNAETLLADPVTGRLYVVSKSLRGGTVYAAPPTLRRDRLNRLSAVAEVPGLVTDGSFFPDGRHVILRTYGSASLYSFPGFRRLGTVWLPAERQGEGIAVGPQGRIYLSSEGAYSPVLRVALPRRLAESAGLPAASSRLPDVQPARSVRTPSPGDPVVDPLSTGDGTPGVLVALGLLAMAVGVVWFTVFRPRGPRRR
jgi:hypothetical protein